uniref:Uncharacterized protein n=1 Tax=Chromera velia CCMP2878 TaxID=1169474 RepID=A0A0G4GXU5_9ALVE|eukprot:Cvel_23777.t1-p1 / transcript=Cvel_23777.t1 / gene=Cvel_23777 / organism=Chromera_velia_CCMP2878 / gene_product=hypothetical protein / transcript_product=hypothetical protein / location=Cvel_scaffold2495:1697-2080(+) / protein_length=128 / sequence_SO=supercontig / SO=protein_coding / is_pseudo=false
MSSRQGGERGKRGVDLRWHPDMCASHIVWCRDTMDQDRILWEIPVEVMMGVTDQGAPGFKIGSYGAVRVTGLDAVTKQVVDVDSIGYIIKPGVHTKHLARGRGMVIDDGMDESKGGENYVTVIDTEGS